MMVAEHVFRGVSVMDVPAEDVRVGDRIACYLSDATAYVLVTGWTDRVRDLTRYDLGKATVRDFHVADAPWWADQAFYSAEIGRPIGIRADDRPEA